MVVLRSWDQFFGTLKIPSSGSKAWKRVRENAPYYAINYLAIYVSGLVAQQVIGFPLVLTGGLIGGHMTCRTRGVGRRAEKNIGRRFMGRFTRAPSPESDSE